ncbi:MAG: UDP-N-acetylmuramate dehydrogenase [Candidatus Pacebacteria bacterium]|nr:UDP-N-acetylmuramate dehydrogenase [Candidatus Paceibacterota bacterium]
MTDTIQKDIPLAPYTTFGIGGVADFFVSVDSFDAVREACQWAQANNQPIQILGHGSNVLISDEGVRGLVIHMAVHGVTYTDTPAGVLVTAGAGVVFDDLVADTVARGLWGLENLSAIPSSVGAAPVQNIGAYGAEVATMITEVAIYDYATNETRRLSGHECAFGYRDSIFKKEVAASWVVTQVTFLLHTEGGPNIAYKDLAHHFDGNDMPTCAHVRDAVIAIRSQKFPDWSTEGNAGSFFKNPVIPRVQYAELIERYPDMPGFPTDDGHIKTSTAWILDHILHSKGVQEGSVRLYERQPLVLVNCGGATATEVAGFAQSIADRVQECCGIALEWEVTQI